MRKLTLRKEALAELTTDEMSQIVGGTKTSVDSIITCPCITPPISGLRCTLSLEENVCS